MTAAVHAPRRVHVARAPDVRPLRIFVPHASDLFTDCQPHGDGLVAFEVAVRLARRGHDVHVAAPRIEIAGAIPATLHLHEIRDRRNRWAFGRLAYMLRVRRLFERLHRHIPVDIIHQLNPVYTGISLALIGTGVPVALGSFVADWPAGSDVLSVRAAGGPGPVRRVKRAIAGLQQHQANALFVTTPAARSRIVRPHRDAAKIVTLPHGIDPSAYAHAESVRDATEPPTILFLGGMEHRKGIFTLLDAFRRVHAAMPACRLAIAGDGQQTFRVVAAVNAMAESTHIDLLGKIPRGDVPRLMGACTVYCMPSFGEPFGMSLLEAMACAKPVVVTDAGGAAHLVDDAGGRKVAPGDVRALADALLEIMAAPELAASMGAHNRRVVESTYSWDRVIARLEECYRSLLPAGTGLEKR